MLEQSLSVRTLESPDRRISSSRLIDLSRRMSQICSKGIIHKAKVTPINLGCQALPWVVIWDIDRAAHTYRCRLMGTEYAQVCGCDMTGKPLDLLPVTVCRDYVRQLLDVCVANQSVIASGADLEFSTSLKAVADMVFYPLFTDDGLSHILAAMDVPALSRVMRGHAPQYPIAADDQYRKFASPCAARAALAANAA